MDTFSQYAQIKDIRLIKEKSGDSLRDFAFIELYTVEDSAFVLERSRQDRVKIKGQQVFLSYSKFKKTDQFVGF
jgi:RNA recognition motif. (a.k.a. RRM, RBD, or RNP domain)